jgi:maltooligosyltrehalose trehalohydrolase
LVAEGRAREFSAFRWQGAIPNPQDADTFARSRLNWSELHEPRHAELLEWYRQLIRLRRDKVVPPRESIFGGVKAVTDFDAKAGWLTFVHNGVLAVFNLKDEPQPVPRPSGEWKLMLSSDSQEVRQAEAVPAQSTLIYVGG